MKKLIFKDAEFLSSVIDSSDYPIFKNDKGEPFPEIVIAGKSNVGKSSLINHLLGEKKLAYTSSKPGKTTTINFYKIDNQIIMLDFPGYGYAQKSFELKEKWSKNFDRFLNERPRLQLLLLLLDSRRNLCPEDLMLYKWSDSKKILCGLIFTKSDKLNIKEIDLAINSSLSTLEKNNLPPPLFQIPYSINSYEGKKILISKIKALFGDI